MSALQNFGAMQRAYDNRTDDREGEIEQVETIDRAMDMLESASRLYNQTVPKFGEANGTVEDAITLLLQIPGITLPADVKARWECWMRGRAS